MNEETFIIELEKINIKVNKEQLETLKKYYTFLKEYNKHTNLTRIVEKEEVYLKHFYDSLTINKAIDLNNMKNMLDIGTGAGFPGVVIKIFYPHINLYLLDSNNKKIKFLKQLQNHLNIEYTLIHDRAESYAKTKTNFFDLVTARAVANLSVLAELALPFIKREGSFIALKGNSSEEVEELKGTEIDCVLKEIIKFELPIENSERTIIHLSKKENTDPQKIREYKDIVKNRLKKK